MNRPEVKALLQALHAQEPQLEREHVPPQEVVAHTSAAIARLLEPAPVEGLVRSLLQTLRESAGQPFGDVHILDVGTVLHIGNSVATLSGLPNARTDELVTFSTGVQGLILNLDHFHVDVILLGPDEGIQGGSLVTATGAQLDVPVGRSLLGRVVNPLGKPLDTYGLLGATERRYLEHDAPGIVARALVEEPLHTGLKIIDALIPIGRGQRELILGDRQTGKTAIAVDTILNQRDGNVLCVYVAIGQKKSSTLSVIETLRRHGALDYTVVVLSSPDDPPAMRYLAPYAGCTIAESLMEDHQDVLIVYDDLSRHADAYRELSLLLRRPPGREAYPGDIFYLHARLLERACKLNDAAGGGSLTALPIVETQLGNMSAYIPTNLISITDGQIVLNTSLFNRGIKPAVDIGRSVSRVGGSAQTAAMRSAAGRLRLELAQYEEVVAFSRLGAEVDESTRRLILRGERLRAILGQSVHAPLPLVSQIAILLAATEGLLDDVALDDIPAFESGLLAHLENERLGICHTLEHTCRLEDEERQALIELIVDYQSIWFERHAPASARGDVE
ncbi:MAG: F0F1 ATP synthase subunit alpha [Anaerolineae bacterium]|nr:F0F1 ATP synthase subunit alpha [Anaerolineae bacterium]